MFAVNIHHLSPAYTAVIEFVSPNEKKMDSGCNSQMGGMHMEGFITNVLNL